MKRYADGWIPTIFLVEGHAKPHGHGYPGHE